ncbi:single-strand binding protein [Fervidobacterium changbaicum]|uniref:Single-stranded DNA-binding protein n=2 Tax=Fervidobacterium TaxID=2422 RepID=A0AAI8CK78_FERIS|nr:MULTISPECIES: single-stranded DNA-binding protein [Fervidobacterium]AMW32085.1 single-stranded DNA-binding protein [Fervidobacterium islandicum]QAV33880.1 single-stranded DNA-binding protein [Fervidobacterium changbaicum]SDH83492.1 single-strand binding protein [Fervidobacterium changbaicum]
MSYNKVVLVGRLTRDPETRQTIDGNLVTTFTIAVNRGSNGDEADFIRVVAFRKLAELAHNYLQKGRMVLVDGKLRINKWKTNDGQTRSTVEIWADNIVFVDSRKGEREIPEEIPYEEVFGEDAEEEDIPGDDEPPF